MTVDRSGPDRSGERGRGAASRGTQVYRALLEEVRNGTLPPGARIREEEIALRLGVSRTPVREALTRLQARGLVENASGGLAVAEITRRQIMQLYAMRAVLEGAAARFAAENASPDDLAGLRHAHEQFCGGDSDDRAARLNATFHEAIYEAAHNDYLKRMLEDLNDSLALLRSTTFSVAGRIAAAGDEHGEILARIATRDADGAEAAARSHIDKAREGRLELLFAVATT